MVSKKSPSAQSKRSTPIKRDVASRKLVDLNEDDLARIIDDRITKALGIHPDALSDLALDPGVMSTPSVLSTVRATAAAMC